MSDSPRKSLNPPAVPELYGPYDVCWNSIPQDTLAKDTLYVFGAHTPHDESGYGVRYQFDWGGGQQDNFDFGWPDPGMPNPSHSWNSAGEITVRVRARYYNPDNGEDCSGWSNWASVKLTIRN